MEALDVTLVYDLESKNVKKVLVFKGILKNSCKELSHFEKKMIFCIKKFCAAKNVFVSKKIRKMSFLYYENVFLARQKIFWLRKNVC